MTFKPYQTVMFLGMRIDSKTRKDVQAKYIGLVKTGPNVGRIFIEVNTVKIIVDEKDIMNYEDYWAIRNGKVDGALPEKAAGKAEFEE